MNNNLFRRVTSSSQISTWLPTSKSIIIPSRPTQGDPSQPQFSYVKMYVISGTSSSEILNGIDVDSNNNIYVAGDSSGNAYIASINESTDTISWQKHYSTSSQHRFSDIVLAEGSGMLYSGGDYGAPFPSNQKRCYLTKHNTSGVLQWQRDLNGVFDDTISSIAVNSSEDIFFGGYQVPYTSSYLVGKYNSSGTSQWYRTYRNDSLQMSAHSVVVDSSSNLFATGYTSANAGEWYNIKFNTSGTVLWQRILSTASAEIGWGIAIDSSGNIYNVGEVAGSARIFKFNTDGTLIWQKGLSIASLNKCEIGPDGFLYIISNSSNIISIFKYTSGGVLVWQRTLSNSTGAVAANDIKLKNNKIYLCGSINNGTNNDMFVSILNTDGSGIGTYILGAMTLTYSAGSYTENVTSHSFSDPAFSWGTPSMTPGTPSLTETNSTLSINTNAIASGGTQTVFGEYRYHTFTNNGTLTVNVGITMDILIVAGGGGGASQQSYGGGGGGGGTLYFSSYGLPTGTYNINIGGGGNAGSNGGPTDFGSLFSAIGGGAGGNNAVGANGGSGGGAAGNGARAGGSPTTGQGTAGGAGVASGGGAGGGGKELIGSDGNFSQSHIHGGAGGFGLYAFGVMYGAGGGGASATSGSSFGRKGPGGAGGTQGDGAGIGINAAATAATSGTINTGNGGGAGATGGTGGSGIVIVRYKI